MNITATGGAEADAPHDASHGHARGPLWKLSVGAVGIVFGDIGTSPIYAFRETFSGHHLLAPDPLTKMDERCGLACPRKSRTTNIGSD